ncbi:MAG: hypothetical protein HC927_07255 [Deltaproteobacteria bacterium]|nr:hypothetical protein [Deltaproteobacteria bacterium]
MSNKLTPIYPAILLLALTACDEEAAMLAEAEEEALLAEELAAEPVDEYLATEEVEDDEYTEAEASIDPDEPLEVTEELSEYAVCATLYEHIHFGGDYRQVQDGAFVSWIGGPWNDQVSSIYVRSGCVLNAYEHINYGGAHASYSGSVPWVGNWWNDKISSYTCTC